MTDDITRLADIAESEAKCATRTGLRAQVVRESNLRILAEGLRQLAQQGKVGGVPEGWDIHKDRFISGIAHITQPDGRRWSVAAGDDGPAKLMYDLACAMLATPPTNQEGAT